MAKGLIVISEGANLQAVDANGNVRTLNSGDRLLPGETLSVSGGNASVMMPDGTMINVADGQIFMLPENGIPSEPMAEAMVNEQVVGSDAAPSEAVDVSSSSDDALSDQDTGGGTLLENNNSGLSAPRLVTQELSLDGSATGGQPNFGQSASHISGGQTASSPRSSGFSTSSAASSSESGEAINPDGMAASSLSDLEAMRAASLQGPSDTRNIQSLQSEHQEVNIDPDDLAMLVVNGQIGCIVEAPNTLTLISGESQELIRLGSIEGIDVGPTGSIPVEMINGELYAFGDNSYYTIDMATLHVMDMGPHNLPGDVAGMTASPMGDGMLVTCSDGGLYHFDPIDADEPTPVTLSMPGGNGMLFDLEMVNGELFASGYTTPGEWHIFQLNVSGEGYVVAHQVTNEPMPEPTAQLFVQNGELYGVTAANKMIPIDLETGEVPALDELVALDDFALLNSDFVAMQEMQAMQQQAVEPVRPEPFIMEQIDFQQVEQQVQEIMENEELLEELVAPGQSIENVDESALQSALEDRIVQNIMEEQQQLEDEFYEQLSQQGEQEFEQQQAMTEMMSVMQESIDEGEPFDPENFMEFQQFEEFQEEPEFQDLLSQTENQQPEPEQQPEIYEPLPAQRPAPEQVNEPVEQTNDLMNFGEQQMVFNNNPELEQNNGQELFIANQNANTTTLISDFDPLYGQGEVLDLSDMLPEDAVDNLDQYLQISFEDGNTTISVSDTENGPPVQNFVLEDVDLSQTFGTTDVADITNQLWDSGSIQL